MNSRTSQQTLTLTYADGVMLGGNDTENAVLILQFVISAYVVCMAALPEWKT